MAHLRRLTVFLALTAPVLWGAELLVYVGAYNSPKSKGIYAWRLDTATGKLESLGLMAETTSPSFLAIHPSRRFLYAVSEIATHEGRKSGAVVAFAMDPKTGQLRMLNKVSSGGPGPCHLVVDKTGKSVLVANYSGGSVAALPIKEDGSLGEATAFIQHTGSSVNPRRQSGPHAHSVNLSPDNRFAMVADLGLDKVLVYRFDPVKGSLEPNEPPLVKVAPGAGPRHFAFHPSGKFAYVINEIGNTITAFSYNARGGVLTEIQTLSTLPADYKETTHTAEVQVHPSGRFVYGSNRGHDSIAVFAAGKDGKLKPLGQVPTQGKTPRNFGIDPTGAFLLAANQATDNITVFRIDRKTGMLTPTGQTLEVGMPVCVKFVAAE